jgi:protein-L-isoaspartate(D-aspartate) O-methyltransferase
VFVVRQAAFEVVSQKGVSMDRLEDFRRVFAEVVFTRGGCKEGRIREAFARVPRHAFVGPGPYQLTEQGDTTSSSDPAMLYQDIGVALVAELGIPTGLPSFHARCLQGCAPRPGERVVHIGAGSGYFTAILAELVGSTGEVLAFELEPELAARASQNLAPWPWVRVEPRSGVTAPFTDADVIYVSAGVEAPPLAWLRALRPSGRLLFPLTPRYPWSARELREQPARVTSAASWGGMLLVTRRDDEHHAAEFLCRAQFIPCIGTEDAAARTRLTAAFAAGTYGDVRSLQLGTDADDSAWYVGTGWWLSTAE